MSDPMAMISALSAQERRAFLAELLAKRAGEPKPAPLSFAQERMWFIDQLQPGSSAYNLIDNRRMHGPLDVPTLERSIHELVNRHEVLRTIFVSEQGQPVQLVLPALTIPVNVVDLSSLPVTQLEEELRRLVEEDARRPFDLAKGPLIRITLLRLASDDYFFLLNMHHIISDGWSVGVFYRELEAIYSAIRMGRAPDLPRLPISYSEYARRQRSSLQGEAFERQLGYWIRQLKDAPAVLELPTDRTRPAVQSLRGAAQTITLPPAVARAVRALGRRSSTTPFMILLAAFYALLHRYTGQTDLLVGAPVAGRNSSDIEPLIGCFLNTALLRVDASGDPSFVTFLGRVRDVCVEAYAHQDVPFEKIVEVIQPARTLAYHPLFQVSFNVRTEPPGPAPAHPEVPVNDAEPPPAPRITSCSAKFDLTLSLVETGELISGGIDYATDLFDHSTITRMISHLRVLLEGIVANPEARLSALPLLTSWERGLLASWSTTEALDRGSHRLHDRIEEQARRTPGAVAVVCDGVELSYGSLDARAEQLARQLAAMGVAPEVLVAVCLPRSIDLIVAILAVLKAGGAYVPLDPEYPPERLAFMLHDSGAAAIVTRGPLAGTLPDHGLPVISVDANRPLMDGVVARRADADNIAYVIYTSGSTGRPKGVLVRHAGAFNSCAAVVERMSLGAGDRVLQFASPSFDTSVYEIMPTLMAGATLVLASHDQLLPGPGLVELLDRLAITVVTLPPSVLAMQAPTALPALRTLQVAGEAFSADAVARWRAGRRFFNSYGPTETTIWAAGAFLDEAERRPVIGRPIPNARLYILDSHLEPVPIGVIGEIYIGGAGVARGYLGQPRLTASAFLPDPFHRAQAARMYRTGDRGRYLSDGQIEYVGRADRQIKLRGIRIELGEVEATLGQHEDVAQVAALIHRVAPGDQRLVAWVVPRTGDGLSISALRRFLSSKLPEAMVPSLFIILDRLPLTPNGKVDHAKLPRPDASRPALDKSYVPPRTPFEEVMVGIWQEVLGLNSVGVDDNFFELGGHSLLVNRLTARIAQLFEIEVPVRRLFESPTVAAFTAAILDGSPERARLEHVAQTLLAVVRMEDSEVEARLAHASPQAETGLQENVV